MGCRTGFYLLTRGLTPAEGTPRAETVMRHSNCEQFVAWVDAAYTT